jgi:hypothetical protein
MKMCAWNLGAGFWLIFLSGLVRLGHSGSPLFYINTWAMVWPNDYPALAT